MTTDPATRQGRPNHRVMAVLASAQAMEATCADLSALGLDPSAIEVLHGSGGTAFFDSSGQSHGVRAHLVQLVKELGGVDAEGIASYREALAAGQYVLALPMRRSAGLRPVVEVLQRHGARDMRFFGRGTMETIPDDYPEPNGFPPR